MPRVIALAIENKVLIQVDGQTVITSQFSGAKPEDFAASAAAKINAAIAQKDGQTGETAPVKVNIPEGVTLGILGGSADLAVSLTKALGVDIVAFDEEPANDEDKTPDPDADPQ